VKAVVVECDVRDDARMIQAIKLMDMMREHETVDVMVGRGDRMER